MDLVEPGNSVFFSEVQPGHLRHCRSVWPSRLHVRIEWLTFQFERGFTVPTATLDEPFFVEDIPDVLTVVGQPDELNVGQGHVDHVMQ